MIIDIAIVELIRDLLVQGKNDEALVETEQYLAHLQEALSDGDI